MLHMLSCFDLEKNVTIAQFQESNTTFIEHLQDSGLVHSAGPVGRRKRHPIMDTDNERDQEYFYTMSFMDENQCNLAVQYIQSHDEPGDSIHKNVTSKTTNQIFICWEDI